MSFKNIHTRIDDMQLPVSPPVLTNEFWNYFDEWFNDRIEGKMSWEIFKYWCTSYQPIEDEL